MRVIISTEWPQVVTKCINEMELGEYVLEPMGGVLALDFHTDFCYRDIAAWLAAALACGLIMRGEIER